MVDQKVVAFVEPSFYGVDFVERTHRKGCKVIAIGSSLDNPKKYNYETFYDDFLIADIRDPQSIYQAIKQSPYYGKLDALIPATDYASHYTAEVAEWLSLPTIPSFAAHNARNKDLARKAYSDNHVPSAQYAKVANYEEACQAASQIGYPVVVKPTNCASSQGVFFINKEEEFLTAFQKLRAFKKTYMGFDVSTDYLVEEYLEGPEFSVELFLKDKEVVFSSVTEKITSDLPYFVEISHTAPTSSQEDKVDEMINVSVQAMLAIGIDNGPSHVEIRLTDTGPKIIEVNGRPGGDNIASQLLFNTYGLDIFEETVNFYLNLPIKDDFPVQKATSIAFLTSRQNGQISSIEGIEIIKNDDSVIKFDISVNPGDTVKIPESSDDRLGYVITSGEDAKEAKRKAMDLINSIQLVYQ
ncbi:ATP-grasp domain-containing protein [Gracilibacillus salinarum]|uniref:ATP-grasp domain-containing protein n=1 Tax=Gracilibacillus salinarum TaxID=2932255 RepID=A0ABY4GH28_9BACI|nr:ATP-grasp domain-containing protein [Gracilibacillus salinarum]UOQ83478.1 ATP-grasp domain-containing protein [Gracilibacillus salinarum]